MLNPCSVNPLALPSVTLEDRRSLPSEPCIYFAIDGQGSVQYIGRSMNPRQRWVSHHRYQPLAAMDGVRISYMAVDADLLPQVETALIEWFKPPLNSGLKSLANLRSRSPVYGEAKSKRQPLVTDEGWEGFKALAAAHGLSASELIERLGRGTLSLSDALGNEPQGEVLTVTKWGIDLGQAVDSQGRRYAVKRVKEAP